MKEVKITLLVIFVFVISIFIVDRYIKKDITIIDDESVIRIRTFRNDFSYLLDRYNFNLSKNDKLSIPINSKLKDEMIIEIERAFSVDIKDENKSITVFTTSVLVKNLLSNNNIKLSKLDRVYPNINSNIYKGDSINIVRISRKEVTETVEIPSQTIIKLVSSLEPDEIEIKSEGKTGEKKVKYEVLIKDGVEISKKIIEEEIILAVEDKIIYKGLDKLFVTSRGMPFRFKEVLIMEATAYDLSYQSTGKNPSHPQYGITYSGTKAHSGVVAVDKNMIKLGSKLYVESLDSTHDYGFASAEDTGSAIKGNRIDLFISDHSRAMAYGRRKVRVYVLDEKISDSELKGYSERRIYGNN